MGLLEYASFAVWYYLEKSSKTCFLKTSKWFRCLLLFLSFACLPSLFSFPVKSNTKGFISFPVYPCSLCIFSSFQSGKLFPFTMNHVFLLWHSAYFAVSTGLLLHKAVQDLLLSAYLLFPSLLRHAVFCLGNGFFPELPRFFHFRFAAPSLRGNRSIFYYSVVKEQSLRPLVAGIFSFGVSKIPFFGDSNFWSSDFWSSKPLQKWIVYFAGFFSVCQRKKSKKIVSGFFSGFDSLTRAERFWNSKKVFADQ